MTQGGSALVYSTYLGGSQSDSGLAIALGPAGSVYVGGTTASADFPIVNAFDPTPQSGRDGFFARIGPTGALLASSYYGGDGEDVIRAIATTPFLTVPSAVVVQPLVAITGHTYSSDLPTVNPLQPERSGASDAFVAVLKPGLPPTSQLAYSTYLGGERMGDEGYAITFDGAGHVHVAGITPSLEFPTTTDALQPMNAGGSDGFITVLDPFAAPAAQLLYSTYLGGSLFDTVEALALDDTAATHVAGATSSSDFPTVAPLQPLPGDFGDAFVSVLSPSGAGLQFSTYLGGSDVDHAYGVAVDAGATPTSPDRPTRPTFHSAIPSSFIRRTTRERPTRS